MGVPGDVRVSGFRCQVSGKRNREAETCWSEAEIPSEAKLQRGTLKPETSALVICYFYSSSTPKQLAIFPGNPARGGTDLALGIRFARTK